MLLNQNENALEAGKAFERWLEESGLHLSDSQQILAEKAFDAGIAAETAATLRRHDYETSYKKCAELQNCCNEGVHPPDCDKLREAFYAGYKVKGQFLAVDRGESADDTNWTVIFIIFLVGMLLGTILTKCSSDCSEEVDEAVSQITQDRVNMKAMETLRGMDNITVQYGARFPDYPFDDPQVCYEGDGSVKKEETEDIGCVLDRLRNLQPYTGYYGRFQYSLGSGWVEFKTVVRLSQTTLLYMKTYRGDFDSFLKLARTELCELRDNRCMNEVANQFIEEK